MSERGLIRIRWATTAPSRPHSRRLTTETAARGMATWPAAGDPMPGFVVT